MHSRGGPPRGGRGGGGGGVGLGGGRVGKDRLVVVVAPGHRWARRGSVGVDELAETPLLQRETGSGTR
ncbi:LysR substrate-binding domain-containing protein, partial [Nocardia cyriacigeorgica]|uniref:LysR substrate-binding domain-containing protein n=1 Tax=Nocardia cyriacigeorgica TaxID=135487 RepID=UPI003CC7F0B0